VLAAGWALVVLAGGCTIGPDWLNPLSKLSGRQNSPTGISRPKDHGTLAHSTPTNSPADPVSLASEATVSADLHVATARLAERSGKVAEAEKHYQQALKIDPDHVDALVGSARPKDRQGQLDEATRLYQQAIRAQPDNASLRNDLGLCYARQKKYQESMATLERAIAMEPKKWLYRNNAAMVLVEMGDVEAAVSHLKAVQGESVALYNVGYILQKKGDSAAARVHFANALEKNPSLTEARIWLGQLGPPEPGSLAQPAPLVASERTLDDGSVSVTDEPSGPPPAEPFNPKLLPPVPVQVERPAPPTPAVQRLPPVSDAARTAARTPALVSGAPESRVAPLPPVSSIRAAPSGPSPRPGEIFSVIPIPASNAAGTPSRLP